MYASLGVPEVSKLCICLPLLCSLCLPLPKQLTSPLRFLIGYNRKCIDISAVEFQDAHGKLQVLLCYVKEIYMYVHAVIRLITYESAIYGEIYTPFLIGVWSQNYICYISQLLDITKKYNLISSHRKLS